MRGSSADGEVLPVLGVGSRASLELKEKEDKGGGGAMPGVAAAVATECSGRVRAAAGSEEEDKEILKLTPEGVGGDRRCSGGRK